MSDAYHDSIGRPDRSDVRDSKAWDLTETAMNKLGDQIEPEITAEWARTNSKRILSDKVQEQLIKALKAVKFAIKNDNDSAPLHGAVHEKTMDILRSRGFKLEKIIGHDQRDPDYIQITW